ncbi:fructose-2,6-bisphosphatase [Xenococcus sp. PCC 7305]|uniref:histidine phosphatase family protein n=1 Tax=Xenococcus sp. PCC 7305 TaxID=102125 RepID=UPI0002ABF8EC|nr:histidine phosphatase family protein [Xenococcus sp. PCC 7305]ELS04970.1 fructose-2,6-bisphosphatase [Xenococcus sp. PCC 7305]
MNNIISLSNLTKSSNSVTSSTKIIIVRHGRTTYNEQGRYQGSSDESVLTEKGHQAAYQTGLALQQFTFDAIYSSPLTRVQETAQEITTALGNTNDNLPPIIVAPKLTEINMSDWQGLFYQEVREKFPKAYHCWQETPHLFTFDNSFFPVRELFKKAQSFWQEILDKHQGQTILIIAHGGTNRALISTAISLEPKDYHSLQQSNCGISYLEFPTNNSSIAKLKCLNFTNHLGEHLPKLKEGKQGWRWLLVSNQVSRKLLLNSCLCELIDRDLIDLVLSDNCEASEILVSNFLRSNHKAVHFPMPQDSFLEIWQQTIFARQKKKHSANHETLVTGLIIVREESLCQILEKTLGAKIPLDTSNNLGVIHYPHAKQQSILQGLLPIDRQLFPQLTLAAA